MAGAKKYQPYPAYKASGVNWLGEIPEGWGVAALKHSVSVPITDGPHETPHFIDEGIPFVSAEAVSSGHIDFNKIRSHISQKDHDRYSQKYLPAFGDIYLVKSGATTGVTAIVETDEVFNIWSPLAAIRCNDEMVPKFVLHFLRSAQFQEAIRLYWSFGTQQNIGMKVIENLQTVVPCKQEQTKIAAFLDHETAKIDALIAKQQRLIALLEEKRQAVISHAVTKGLDPTAPLRPSGIDWLGDVPAHWEVCRIKHLARTISKGTTPSTVGGELTSSGVRFLKAENIGKSLEVSPLPEFYISELMDEQISRSRLCADDVLVIIAGATTGLASVISKDLLPANTNQAVSFIRPEKSEHAFYILHWLSTEFAQRTIWLGAVQAAQPNLSMESLGNIPIALPPSGEMQAILFSISAESHRFASLLQKAQSAITLLKERRTALISAAVTGKIDLRGWQAPSETQSTTQDKEVLA